MKTQIYSREAIELQIKAGLQKNTAAISFRDREMMPDDPYCIPVKYPQEVAVFYCVADDITHDDFASCHPKADGLTVKSFFVDAFQMAKFVLEQVAKGVDTFICQCEFGQSRSAGAAAAIQEFYNKNGAKIFEDLRYSPNRIIYEKLLKELEKKDGK